MFLVENPGRVWCHIEPIDFEDDEYLFWDAQGRGVRLTLERGQLTKIEEAENEITLQEAFARYSRELGATVDTTGTLSEVWARLQSNVKPQSRLSRMAQNAVGFGCLLIITLVGVFVLILLGGVIKAIFALLHG